MHRSSLSVLALAFLLVACGDGGPGLKSVPRNRILIMDCAETGPCTGQIKDFDSFNPYLAGTTSRTGSNFLYEPLYFYNAFVEEDNLIPWIATGHRFNDDYTEVVIDLREGVEWSDGMPWTADDVVFTLQMLKDHAPTLSYSTDIKTWVKEAVAEGPLRVRVALTAPNPRFIDTYFTYNFGIGVPIVPKHIWEGQDAETFANFDPAKGWPVVSGPYQLASSQPQQRIWDLRPDWWAAKTGFHDLPKVERLIYLPYMEETKRVQNLLRDAMDTSLDLRPPNIQTVVEDNPRMSTWTGREPPYGYLDFWPISLGFNCLEAPFDDPRIRRAIAYAIDREELVRIGWLGSGSPTLLPFPDYPPMRRFTSKLQGLLQKYEVGVFDRGKSAAIMQDKGWAKDDEGYWVKDGQRLRIVIDIAQIFQDLTPVLVRQLERAGFEADFRMTSDLYSRQTQGTAKAYLNGHGGSVSEPHYTLTFYHSRHVRPTGTAAEYFWRWSNAEYDALVDQIGQTAPDDPRMHDLFGQAMEIWLAELPSIPLVQWYHRIPHNTTYWKNWPTEDNPYIHSAYWHRTWLLVLLGLEPAQ